MSSARVDTTGATNCPRVSNFAAAAIITDEAEDQNPRDEIVF